ncbi:hypothetical protein B9T34_07400 [Acinetobacter sp. ANC 3813]|nr:hypothetical protein B9T34_07400 [Acinetobacter sp. ANC 3813]
MKKITLVALMFTLSGCQLISPIFVDYYGVRMDAAKWINHQPMLSMQQKRSLAQLSKALQPLNTFNTQDSQKRLELAKQYQIAMHCAHMHVTDHKINQLQQIIFGNEKEHILMNYQQQAPQFKLDEQSIRCE